MLTINIAKILIGLLLIIVCSCNSSRCYYRKFDENPRFRFSYKLTTSKDKYTFVYRQSPNVITTFSGKLVKNGFAKYTLVDDYDADSIAFPFKYVNDTSIQSSEFKLELPISMLIAGKLLLNDTVFFEKEFDKWTRLVDTTLIIKNKPKKIQLIFDPEKDLLFKKYNIDSRSVIYLVPDMCNTLLLAYIPIHSRYLGYKNLIFDTRKKILCVDTDCIEFERCK